MGFPVGGGRLAAGCRSRYAKKLDLVAAVLSPRPEWVGEPRKPNIQLQKVDFFQNTI